VSEGHLSTTGGALFSDVHVMPGTVFVGRMTLHDVTEPELLAVLYSLITTEEIGGRSGVYGTIKVELVGIRCGHYSVTTSLELADEIAGNGLDKPSKILEALKKRVEELGYIPVTNDDVLKVVDPTSTGKDAVFTRLWVSNMEYVKQMVKWIKELQGKKSSESTSKRTKK
jgi:CRISPR type I-D-associated protein Csc2